MSRICSRVDTSACKAANFRCYVLCFVKWRTKCVAALIPLKTSPQQALWKLLQCIIKVQIWAIVTIWSKSKSTFSQAFLPPGLLIRSEKPANRYVNFSILCSVLTSTECDIKTRHRNAKGMMTFKAIYVRILSIYWNGRLWRHGSAVVSHSKGFEPADSGFFWA